MISLFVQRTEEEANKALAKNPTSLDVPREIYKKALEAKILDTKRCSSVRERTGYEEEIRELYISRAAMEIQMGQKKQANLVFEEAMNNIMPVLEVKARRIGGATFQVPTEIRPDRKESISMKNMISFARKRGGKTMADKLAAEIMDAYNNQGGAFKRKEDMHRMAEANRAFAHFRF